MLKIKDNVDKQELLKFGLKEKKIFMEIQYTMMEEILIFRKMAIY